MFTKLRLTIYKVEVGSLGDIEDETDQYFTEQTYHFSGISDCSGNYMHYYRGYHRTF